MVLSSGIYLFWNASQASATLIQNEDRACEVLDAIARAQLEFHEIMTTKEKPRFGTLDELMAVRGSEVDYFDIGSELRRLLETSSHQGSVFANEDYCFAVYLVDHVGFALTEDALVTTLNPEFWIAYAWPRHYGANGRRAFVLDSHGILRSWNNLMNGGSAFVGMKQIPPAHLAPAPEEHAYPMAKKPQGTQRVNKWLLE